MVVVLEVQVGIEYTVHTVTRRTSTASKHSLALEWYRARLSPKSLHKETYQSPALSVGTAATASSASVDGYIIMLSSALLLALTWHEIGDESPSDLGTV
jgi:hypothetical protein